MRLAVPITEYLVGAHLNFTHVCIYGKFLMFKLFDSPSSGTRTCRRRRTAHATVVGWLIPAVCNFDFDWRVAFNVGIVSRVRDQVS